MNILNSANTAATINKIIHNAQGTTKTSEGATAAGKIIKENLPDIISAGFDMPHPTSVFEGVPPFSFISNGTPLLNWIIYGNTGGVGDRTANMVSADSNRTAPMANLGVEWTKGSSEMIIDGQATGSYSVPFATLELEAGVYTLSITGFEETGQAKTGFYLSGVDTIRVQSTRTYTIAETTNAVLQIVVNPTDITYDNRKITIMLSKTASAIPYEPYGYYKIPVICGNTTTNIYIDEPLTSGETISYSDTGVIIPTKMFLNTLSVDTTVQPEKVFIEYVK